MHLVDNSGLVSVTAIIAIVLVRLHFLYKNGCLIGP